MYRHLRRLVRALVQLPVTYAKYNPPDVAGLDTMSSPVLPSGNQKYRRGLVPRLARFKRTDELNGRFPRIYTGTEHNLLCTHAYHQKHVLLTLVMQL